MYNIRNAPQSKNHKHSHNITSLLTDTHTKKQHGKEET